MSNLIKLAKAIKTAGRDRPFVANWYKAECVKLEPLKFSAVQGNIFADAETGLVFTSVAASREWHTGDNAAAIISGSGMLIIDKI